MCGLVGFFGFGEDVASESAAYLLRAMMDAIIRRGPDSAGYWLDEEVGIALGHRRLAILDLTESGAQPMRSACGRYVIAFNGEIYNHQELRAALEVGGLSPTWRGHSDTETLLAGFAAWGIRKTIEQTVGMFAFAVWDRRERCLTLSRDRMGEKPLYFGFQGQGSQRVFLFASELKALAQHPAFERRLDVESVHLLMRHNYVPDPRSIYQGIEKLSPGSLLTLPLETMKPRSESYWSLTDVLRREHPQRGELSFESAVDELETLIAQSVRGQMLSDVPLGAFLSGGIDSSTIVAMMQKQSSRAVKTFTIGFEKFGFDESPHAEAVARHLGTDHTTLKVTGQQAREVIPQLASLYCEPFSDSSQIPTYLVASLARQHVTVALSGDAGDELFAGYNRYVITHDLWRRLASVPIPLRRQLGRALRALPEKSINKLANLASPLLPISLRLSDPAQKIRKASNVLAAASVDDLYRGVVSHWDPSYLMRVGVEPTTLLTQQPAAVAGLDDIERMMALDTLTYLPGDILVKVDRAAMGVSLETRVPLLDHRIVEWAWSLPLPFKLRGGQGKQVLREVLYRHVPRELIERPKMGFGVPLAAWLRGPLKDWAATLLDRQRLESQGLFNADLIEARWNQHISGRVDWAHHLWDVLVFQAWFDQWNPIV